MKLEDIQGLKFCEETREGSSLSTSTNYELIRRYYEKGDKHENNKQIIRVLLLKNN